MKKTNGITLIALIITIIIMLILVAVTISILINSGLIGKAKQAGEDYKTSYEQEQRIGDSITIDGVEYNSIDEYINGSTLVVNPYKDKTMYNAWTYTTSNGWEGPYVDETTLSNAEVVVRMYENGTVIIDGNTETAYSMVIEGNNSVLYASLVRIASLDDRFLIAGAINAPTMPWDDIKQHVTEVIVCEGITGIDEGFFAEYHNLKSITLPQTINTLELCAFQGCASLESIIIPEKVTYIPTGCFRDCSKLAHIQLPQGLKSIAQQAFSMCSSLKEIVIPENITYINENVFAGCSGLTIIMQNDYSTYAPWSTVSLTHTTTYTENYTIRIVWPNRTLYYY